MSRSVKVVAEGLRFGEAPRWRHGRLWFSDFFDHAVKSVSPAGDVRVEVELDDQPSGLGWTPDGDLLIVSMTRRRLLRRAGDGRLTLHADLSGIAAFHCNDMVVDGAGGAYVGNFGFDLHAELAARDIASVLADHPTARLAYVAPNGAVGVAAGDMHFPNGSVITPDGRTLILAETLGGRLTAFDIGAGGQLTGRRVWAETGPARPPDGICLNAAGQVWLANPIAPECVLVAEGGAVIDVIDTGDPCFACMLGGEDGRSLFMLTARSSDPHLGGDARTGRVLATGVDSPHAGRP